MTKILWSPLSNENFNEWDDILYAIIFHYSKECRYVATNECNCYSNAVELFNNHSKKKLRKWLRENFLLGREGIPTSVKPEYIYLGGFHHGGMKILDRHEKEAYKNGFIDSLPPNCKILLSEDVNSKVEKLETKLSDEIRRSEIDKKVVKYKDASIALDRLCTSFYEREYDDRYKTHNLNISTSSAILKIIDNLRDVFSEYIGKKEVCKFHDEIDKGCIDAIVNN